MDTYYLKENKKSVIVISAVLLVVLAWFFFGGQQEVVYEATMAERGELVQEVSVTGKLKAAEAADLSFERSGRVARIMVASGEEVYAGQVLASLANADLVAKVSEAQSVQKNEEARLDELRRGTRAEELAVSQARVASAETDLYEAREALRERISDAYIKSDDAVRTQADQFISSARSEHPQLSFATESTLERDIESGRRELETIFSEWHVAIVDNEDLTTLADRSVAAVEVVKSFLANVAYALSVASSYSSLSQSTIDAYSVDISAARTAVSTSASNLVSTRGSVNTAVAALTLAKQELALAQAGATDEEIYAQEASVEQAKSAVLAAQAELAKTIIVAPFSGTVTKMNIERGETVAANTPVISLITPANFEIETFVPEADIAKVVLGDGARVTLDAYDPSRYFNANVVSVESAETVLEGVSTYKVVLEFIDPEGLGRSGMTANVDILTGRKEDVVTIPARAIEYRDGDKYVQVVTENGGFEERKIETGLRGSGGRIEVFSGISAGERVILFFGE
ncbi:MAG: efflux RND transporter periplasmic adaptor subunit [Candidatus Pacebacteria bacterium]|nr:efflux RND transporter periplasmic adaptor subunit [Candidatus Paceibacterota bacterium]